MMSADSKFVSHRAISRGLSQVGYAIIHSFLVHFLSFLLLFSPTSSLGSGNHYCEVQVIEEIFDSEAAGKMGLHKVGQIVVFIHSGSRGLGHQVIGLIFLLYLIQFSCIRKINL
jgi:hypothetical protein